MLSRWSKPVPGLDNLESLRRYFELPLKDEDKIPITQAYFDRLCGQHALHRPIIAEALPNLFRVSADECAEEALEIFSRAVKQEPPQTDTDGVFHFTYDMNISEIVGFILSNSRYGRNTNHNTSTTLQRPDYNLTINNHCLLRGEEKGVNSTGNPRNELVEKLVWTYSPLPYIFGLLSFYCDLTKFLCIYNRIFCNDDSGLLCGDHEARSTNGRTLSSRPQ